MNTRHFAAPLFVLSLLLAAGVRAEEPKVTAPHPAAAPANLPPGHPPVNNTGDMHGASQIAGAVIPTAEGRDLLWTVPAGWESKPGASMRKGSYRVKAAKAEADLAITAFPGATGGLDANLNRWRGQVGLAPLPPAEVTAAVEKFEANGLSFIVVDYQGPATQLLGAIVAYNENSWFFKLTGPTATVSAAKADYRQFLHSIKAP